MDRNVGVIRLDEPNTVKNLRDKLKEAFVAGYADSGFPIVRPDYQGLRVAGYIGFNELEHALGEDHHTTTIFPENQDIH